MTNDEQEEKPIDPVARTKAKLDRNWRMIRRLEAMRGGKTRTYDSLNEIADVLSIRPDEPPTPDQLQQIKELLIEQREAITRLIDIIDRTLQK